MINVDKIFILHHPPLVERKNYLNDFFIKNNIDVEWVEKFTPEEIKNNYDNYIKNYDIFPNIHIYEQYNNYKNYGIKIPLYSLSLYLKHFYCFEKSIKEKYNNIIIFEDDITLQENIIEYLNKNIEEFNDINEFGFLPDMLMIGKIENWDSKKIRPNKFTHFDTKQLTRCTHAILYNLNTIHKIYNNMFPINKPIDHKLNEIIVKENLKVSWSEPGLLQKFKSSVR